MKVLAEIADVADALQTGGGILSSERFAGFRGEEAVGGEPVVVNVSAIAYVSQVPAP